MEIIELLSAKTKDKERVLIALTLTRVCTALEIVAKIRPTSSLVLIITKDLRVKYQRDFSSKKTMLVT